MIQPTATTESAVEHARQDAERRRVPRRSGYDPKAGGGGVILRAADTVSSTQDGTNKRWKYKIRLQVKSTAGHDGWANDPNDPTEYDAYNLNESANGATGTYGNGSTQSDITAAGGTFALKPIPDGVPVAVMLVPVADGTAEWWIINLPNGVTGTCA